MKCDIGEILIISVILIIIGGIMFAGIGRRRNSSATLLTIVEFNGHTYIENYRSDTIVHNPDCTNSKCFK